MKNQKIMRSAKAKAQIGIAALSNQSTINEIASKNNIHPTQVRRWRDKIQNEAESLFTDNHQKAIAEKDKQMEELYKQIGQQKVEADWLKKKFGIIH